MFLTLLALAAAAMAQQTTLRGVVTDSLTGERLPYVALAFPGTTIGTSTADDGSFTLTTSTPGKVLEVSYLGYATKRIPIRAGRTTTLDIRLVQDGLTLQEVVIEPKRERYRRRDNPAVAFVRRVIEMRDANDPRQHDYYSYDRYEKITIARNDYQPKPRTDGKTGKFDFLTEFVDTLDAGTTILPLSEKERKERVFYRRDPHAERSLLEGSHSAGLDEVLASRDGVQQFLDETLQEVDIFQNNIPLFLQRFVSPLSTLGPTFYKYYLMDTLQVDGHRCVDLGFVPFSSESFGFTGHLFVRLDSTYFVQRAQMNVPQDINPTAPASLPRTT